MDYSNIFINIISVFISLVTWLSFFSLITVMLQKVTTRSNDLFQYKLRNKYLSLFFAGSYIIVFILFLYGLRVYNLHRTVDLKEVYQSFKDIYCILTVMDLYLLFLFVLLLLSLLIVLLNIMHNFFTNHIFMLYIYYVYSYDKELLRIESRSKLHKFQRKFYDLLFKINGTDIISYYINELGYKLTKIINGPTFDYNTLSNYHFYRLFRKLVYGRSRDAYRLFIMLSPFLVIIYDCICNNWVLYHVYHYLLIYIPIILIKRITTFVGSNPNYILNIIWNIYYKQDKNCIYAISKNNSIILTSYLLSGLKVTPDLIDLQLSNIPFCLYHSITFTLYNKERNTYINDEGIYLQKTLDNRLFLEMEVVEDKEDDYKITYSLGEEWILLADHQALETDIEKTKIQQMFEK